jgi:hypothetical protein
LITDFLQWLTIPLGITALVFGGYLWFRFKTAGTRLAIAIAWLLAAVLFADSVHVGFSILSAMDWWHHMPSWLTASLRVGLFSALIIAELKLKDEVDHPSGDDI